MGVLRTLFNLVIGPSLIYLIFVSHVMYQSFIKAPQKATAPAWPSTFSAREQADLIAQRKGLVKGYYDVAVGKNVQEFTANYWTKDFQFEDPFQKLNGRKEASDMFFRVASHFKEAPPKVNNEFHGPHEIILDLTFPAITRGGWDLGVVNAVIHLLLEPPSKPGDPEKIFKIYDEYNGNPLLNERTFTPSFVGSIHSRLRLYQGYLITWLINKDIL